MDAITIVNIATAAMQGVEEAVSAWPTIKALVTSGQDPTAEQQAAIDAAADAAHAALQAAGPTPPPAAPASPAA